ncbi:50S ribosomal protein L21e [Candidatus Pacearchaeota archaeon]|nr:50S ribosomal protein L21e [Candidatus Pacearchaeota archaeon]
MRKKQTRTKGKIKFSRYFQELKEGDKVSVIREMSMPANFPKRFQGRTGIVEGRRGKAYIVLIKDNDKGKKFIIQPIHLIKIKQ